MRLGRNKQRAILVMDIQNDFTGKNAKMPANVSHVSQMISNLNKIIDKAAQNDLIVIYVVNEYARFDVLNFFRNFCCNKRNKWCCNR